jgi:PST family polysaccharide transporter/lipopolysaccharide exporter
LTIAGVVFAAAPGIAELFAEPRATNVIRLLAFRPLLEATGSIKVAKLTRDLNFRSLTLISVPVAVIDTVVAVSLAQSLGVWALVAGALAGAAAGVMLSYVVAPHRPRLSLSRTAVRPLVRYGRWILVTGMVGMVGSSVVQAVIARKLGTASLGLYFLADKIASLPAEVASKVVGPVAFPLYARLQLDVRQATRAFQGMLTGMSGILCPIYAVLIALAPSLVRDVLGPQWAGTAPVIQVLAVVGIVSLLSDAIVPALNGVGQPYKVVSLEVVQSLFMILLVSSLAGQYGVVGAALAWLPGFGVCQIISAVFARQMFGRPFAGLSAPMTAIMVASVAGAAVALGLDSLLSGLGGFVTAAFLSASVTGWLLWVLDRHFDLGFAANLPRVFPQVAALMRLSPVDR